MKEVNITALGKYSLVVGNMCLKIQVQKYQERYYTFINSSNLRMDRVASILGKIYNSSTGGHYVYYGITKVVLDSAACTLTVEGYADAYHKIVHTENLYILLREHNPIVPVRDWILSCKEIV